LEMDENGNLWMVSQGSAKVFLVVSGLPISTPPPPPPPPDPAPTPVTTIRDVVAAMPDAAFRNLGLRRAFEARVNDIMRSMDAKNPVPAVQMLRTLLMRTDGCGSAAAPDQDDWIIDCKCQSAVRTKIDTMINDLNKKLGR
jgi:hypothetical protein